jgi:probable F420-dependent oxidoreductase
MTTTVDTGPGSGPAIGVLFNTDRMSGSAFIDYCKRLERAGIESMWLAELFGREPFAAAGAALANTETLRVGTAIANVYARDAVAAAAASATLAELSGNRFELGLGVSNRGLNETRGHQWTAPAPRLAAYLEAVRGTKLSVPEHRYPIHVAAHGPKMLAVAADGADGVFTYLMNPAHTERTSGGLPANTAVSPMMMCLRCEEPDRARALARKAIGYYTGLDYYHRAWRTLGFDDADFADGGSDRLIDSIIAWGSVDDIRRRLSEQRQAGATRVVIIPLNAAGGGEPDWELLDQLVT